MLIKFEDVFPVRWDRPQLRQRSNPYSSSSRCHLITRRDALPSHQRRDVKAAEPSYLSNLMLPTMTSHLLSTLFIYFNVKTFSHKLAWRQCKQRHTDFRRKCAHLITHIKKISSHPFLPWPPSASYSAGWPPYPPFLCSKQRVLWVIIPRISWHASPGYAWVKPWSCWTRIPFPALHTSHPRASHFQPPQKPGKPFFFFHSFWGGKKSMAL